MHIKETTLINIEKKNYNTIVLSINIGKNDNTIVLSINIGKNYDTIVLSINI